MSDESSAKSRHYEIKPSDVSDSEVVHKPPRLEPKKPLLLIDSYILAAIQYRIDERQSKTTLEEYAGLPSSLIDGRIEAIKKNYNYVVIESKEDYRFQLEINAIANDQDTANILISLYDNPQIPSPEQYHIESDIGFVTTWCLDAGYLRKSRNGLVSTKVRVKKEWSYLQLLRSKKVFSKLQALIKTIDWDDFKDMKLLEVEAFSSISELMPPKKKVRNQSLIALPKFPPNADQLTLGQFKEMLATITSKDDIDKLRAAQNYAQEWVDAVQERIKEVLEIPPTEATISFRVKDNETRGRYMEARWREGDKIKGKYVRHL